MNGNIPYIEDVKLSTGGTVPTFFPDPQYAPVLAANIGWFLRSMVVLKVDSEGLVFGGVSVEVGFVFKRLP